MPASDFENVPTMKSTSSSTPWASAQPRPVGPYVPSECASSTSRYAPCARHTSTMSRSGATSPRIEYSPSTTTRRLPPGPGSRSSFLRRLSAELWRKPITCAAVCRVDDVGMKREAEVIVRAEHQRRPAAHHDFARPEHLLDHRLARHRRAVREFFRASLDRPQLVQ